jgi:4-amino-4-deoxy-L-arabinose transferase-like glycosyltransferase
MPGRRSLPSLLPLALVFALALLLRLEYLRHTEVVEPFRADAGEYARYAANLLEHGTFSRATSAQASPSPDAFRSPGYPAFLALALWLDGRDPLPLAYGAQALLSALLVPLTFGLGVRFLPRRGALAAALLVALSPHLVTLSGYLLTEVLFAFLLLAALAALARALARGSLGGAAVAGALFGGAALVNETALLVPPLLAAAAWATRERQEGGPGGSREARALLLVLGIFALFPAAWSLRNAVSLPPGALSGSDRARSTLLHGTYPDFVHRDPRFRYYAYREDPLAPEMRKSFAQLARVVAQRASERPLRYLSWYLIEKPLALWSWGTLQGSSDIHIYEVRTSLYETSRLAALSRAAMRALHPLLLLVSVLGIPLCLAQAFGAPAERARARLSLLLLVLGAWQSALGAVFAPWPRYAMPLRPELYLFATWSALEALRALRARARPPLRPAAAPGEVA